ncbi:hypothetical protein [Mitsuaria sp. 7]|uniref:hypothetical protein n=1 Tax=Mitsuaria sp. 7 TaxID=1658665 RepID=UPI0012FCE4D0|nr:hypothetical protein [Mitsuaria sp. 7]
MENQFNDAFFYFLPGVLAGVPYWVMWPIRRSFRDVVLMIILFAANAQFIGRFASALCQVIFGSTLMFGAWGEAASLAALSSIGAVIAVLLARHCRRIGKKYYPFEPIYVR